MRYNYILAKIREAYIIVFSYLIINKNNDERLCLMFYILLNVFGFILMYLDKQFAIKKMRRIPEKVLFLISLAGSATGVLFGMLIFNHKTRKPKFLIFMPILVILNIIFFLLT